MGGRGARSKPAREADGASTGNYVAEWFGHRVWPLVDTSATAAANQTSSLCPFLSNATATRRECVKRLGGYAQPTGVCTISSDSNGVRQDWLACPIRTLDADFTLLVAAIRTTYLIAKSVEVLVLPVTVLAVPTRRLSIKDGLARHARIFLFAGAKVGGEVDFPETETSPGSKVDVSVIEVLGLDPVTRKPTSYGKHMLYEIQTADFHGSPLHAVRKLRALCPRVASPKYHHHLQASPEIAGQGVEGPNKANIFKRTIYQMIIKIQLASHNDCVPNPRSRSRTTSWLGKRCASSSIHVEPQMPMS